MASNRLFLLVILSIVGNSLQDTSNNEIEEEEINPFAEAASAILKEQNAQNIGAMVNSFMQSGGAAQLGNVLSKFGGENAGQLLQGLASLVGSDQKEGRAEDGSNSAVELLVKIKHKFENSFCLIEFVRERKKVLKSELKLSPFYGTIKAIITMIRGDTTANLLEGLGSLMGAFQGGGQGGGGDGVSAILQGLGSF
ncbi:hypothetical protein NQ317_019514 [Molorchus minor]|uniref:Uncharacterized protein n=1 Tax=Molorchus minor TaxID=1323400 RepID=A0ABQ9JXC7_9CUCU|nr:hypothetical protein NQ317_019514 [Molorchus minor]